MKKIFYGLFFFVLTFLSTNVVRADDRYCTYEIEGTNATIVARIGNNDVYVDYSNAKGKGGEYGNEPYGRAGADGSGTGPPAPEFARSGAGLFRLGCVRGTVYAVLV